jgi:surface antigen
VFAPAASAANVSQQITQLKRHNAAAEQQRQQLSRQAATLAGTIAGLQSEIAVLDGQINQTAQRVASLQAEIVTQQAELAHQRELLAMSIREMYTGQDMTTLEMLASSQTFSHFLDQNQYRQSVQEKIDATTNQIKALVTKLDQEKQSVEQLLADQQAMQDTLNTRRAENTRLLGLNQSQQQAFQDQMNANSAHVAELQRQQAAENRKGFVSRPRPAKTASATTRSTASQSYPWAKVPFPNSLPDPWGMYKRQCVSYTAWKVASSGRYMPYWGGRGDAKKWDDNARAAGIAVDGNPHAGDVAISNAGAYGHAMYVEAVNNDGTIDISQYNADWRGNYSQGRRSASGLSFIHF